MQIKGLRFSGVFIVLLAFALTACNGSAPEPVPDPEQTLEERVLARWGHMIERDFESAWDYYSPGFRQTTPQHDFVRDMAQRSLRWLDAELLDIECAQNDICEVRLEVTARALGAPGGLSRMRVPSRFYERWVRLDGQWWYLAN